MYLAIDVGGTKTLIALFSGAGEMESKVKIQTPQAYEDFIESIKNNTNDITEGVKYCVMGIPGLLNREKGIVYALGNLPWRDKPIASDISKALGGIEVKLENDARLAGLAEATALDTEHNRILYLTISTGIGGALVVDKKIVKELRDIELGHILLRHENKLDTWEKIASGKTLVETYGMKAAEITDPKIWEEIGNKIAYGIGVLCPVLQPEVIVFGGGVGQFADKFSETIKRYLKENLHPVVIQPSEILGPKFAEDNVLQGCYELAAQNNQ
jgi:glucokinase